MIEKLIAHLNGSGEPDDDLAGLEEKSVLNPVQARRIITCAPSRARRTLFLKPFHAL